MYVCVCIYIYIYVCFPQGINTVIELNQYIETPIWRNYQYYVSVEPPPPLPPPCTVDLLHSRAVLLLNFIYNAPVSVLQKTAPSTVQLHTLGSIHS